MLPINRVKSGHKRSVNFARQYVSGILWRRHFVKIDHKATHDFQR